MSKAYRKTLSRYLDTRTQGFNVTMSEFLELRAADAQKAVGLDLANYLLDQWDQYNTVGFYPQYTLPTADNNFLLGKWSGCWYNNR